MNPGGGGSQTNGRDHRMGRAMGVIGKGVLRGPFLRVPLLPPFPADHQSLCRRLPPLPHEQGAGAEGGAAGSAGAGAGVWRPRAGPGLCACLSGHPPSFCAHRPRAGPSPATAAAAPAAGVSSKGKPPGSHLQPLYWPLPPFWNQESPHQNPPANPP